MDKTLTIFTPAYNRAYTLHKCYESLKRQTNKNFKWMIIDDGSTDNTVDLVAKWKEKSDFEMHTAHNTAYQNIDTELNVCIDSDDYLTDDAVEIIVSEWEKVKSEKLAGLGALNVFESGEIIGSKFPENIKLSKYFDIYNKYGVVGDKKFIYRTELIKKFPYPEYEGEKYVGLDYKYKKLDEEYELALINKVVCVVEYMEDGSSKNMLKQYRNNPRGWCFFRVENLKIPNTSLKFKFKESIHYVSSSLMIKDNNLFQMTPYKSLAVLAFPFGYLLKVYIVAKTNNR